MKPVSFRAHLSLAGFGLSGVYAVLALALLAMGQSRTALVFAASAAVTGALIAIILPLLAPRGGDSDDDEDGGSGGGGDGPPPPPWWPEFEREFWSHVRARPERGGRGPRREREPA